MLIDPDDLDSVQAGWVLDEQTPALSREGVVGGVPRHAQSFGNSGHRQVADDDPDQTPPQAGAGDLGPRRRRSGGILTPHVRHAPKANKGDLSLMPNGATPVLARPEYGHLPSLLVLARWFIQFSLKEYAHDQPRDPSQQPSGAGG